jgi:hypothetical protein
MRNGRCVACDKKISVYLPPGVVFLILLKVSLLDALVYAFLVFLLFYYRARWFDTYWVVAFLLGASHAVEHSSITEGVAVGMLIYSALQTYV